jgi:hypothetical protein
MPESFLDDLILYCGSMNNMEARVHAVLDRPVDGEWQLAGRVIGPRCEFARTLPATIALQSVPWTSGMKCVATVPDPCFWTPDLPMLYDVRVELRRDGELVDLVERPLAIRALVPRGRDLFLGAKRWVIRGARQSAAPDSPLSAWCEAGAAMLVDNLDEKLADEAARLGVPLVAMIRAKSTDSVTAELQRLARFPAVIIAAIDAAADLPGDIGLAAIDIRRAAYCRAEAVPPALPVWACMLLCESADAGAIARAAAGRDYPVIALRPIGQAVDIAIARAACDKLQADLAPQVDLAGYIV